ncbi:transketolase family protein [bacterium]
MESKATRYGYGEGVAIAAQANDKITVLTADVTTSVVANIFQNKFPDRFYNLGVAEQNLIGTAAGLALQGLVPFATAYSVFITGRAWDQIRNTICYSNLNVKIVGSHSGLMVGPDGATHQALEDIAILRSIPNIKIIVPCDYIETIKAVKALSEDFGPAYLRVGRSATPILTDENTPFEIGKMNIMKEGHDLTIFACGSLVNEAVEAAKILEHENIKAKVVNVHTVKPLDEKMIIESAKATGAIVTCEEHQLYGGLGSAISEVIVQNHPVPIEMIGVKDEFGESGDPKDLMIKYGLKDKNIVDACKKVLNRK